MKKIILVLSVIAVITISSANAQKSSTYNTSSYTTAIGIKFYPTGVTLKHFLKDDKKAVEFIGYFYNYGTRITGLYEIHSDINGVEGLKWYIGPGAHLGFYNTKYGGGTTIGVDGVLGLDYKINSAPINLSLDWQPSFEFGDKYNNGFQGNWGGIDIRYTF